MPHPDLEGARRKLARAEEHVWDLSREVARWERTNIALATQTESDGAGGLWVTVNEVSEPPPILRVIFGEALQAARSCLDLIAWQIVQRDNPVLAEQRQRSVLFPIVIREADFPSSLRRHLPGIGEVEATIIRRYQPFTRTPAADHPLAVLSKLANQDKHRTLHVVAWRITDLDLQVDEWDPGCEPSSLEQGPDVESPVRVGSKLARIRLKSTCKDRVHVRVSSTLTALLENGWRVDTVLEKTIAIVKEILGELDRVL